jgi:hypothetical protein
MLLRDLYLLQFVSYLGSVPSTSIALGSKVRPVFATPSPKSKFRRFVEKPAGTCVPTILNTFVAFFARVFSANC